MTDSASSLSVEKGGRVVTQRWNDPPAPGDGHRLLVCRYRPRGVRKEAETWDAWSANLAPSRELLARHHGKDGAALPWSGFRDRYLAEMKLQHLAIASLASRVAAGEALALLCSSACTDPERCHRTILRGLVLDAFARLGG